MELHGKVAVVTGAGNGLGEALARRFAECGAAVVLGDLEGERVTQVARETGGIGLAGDMTVADDVRALAALAEATHGRVDLWVSNAGTSGPPEPAVLPDPEQWDRQWRLHVMAHVHAARAVLPGMVARGGGYLFQVVSRAGITLQPEKVVYSVTKRASIALGEWLALHYRPRGIAVTCFCPAGMRTRMLAEYGLPEDHPRIRAALPVEQVADLVVDAIRAERFLLVADPEAVESLRERYEDWDAYLDSVPTALRAEMER